MKKRILVVEDNHIHRLLTEDFLSHQGYRVESIVDGSHFLPILESFQPDLIMLDLRLPVADGFTLLAQLEQSPWHTIPVIVVSAYSFESEKQRARNFGVRHYFTKPVSLEILGQCVASELSIDPPADPLTDQ